MNRQSDMSRGCEVLPTHLPSHWQMIRHDPVTGLAETCCAASIVAVSVPITDGTRNGRKQDKNPCRDARGYNTLSGAPSVSFRQMILVRLLCQSRYGQDQGQYPDDDRESCEVFLL